MAEPEPEVEGEVEPEAESEAELSESEPPIAEAESPSTEPEPYWPTAFEEYGPAWELHVYACTCIFILIAMLTVCSMTYYLKNRQSLKQGTLTFTLQCLLSLFTVFRSLSMFINPYQTAKNLPKMVFLMMWSMALPGLTASFSVLLLVFLDTTKMTLGPPVFQRLPVLLTFTACHFVIVMLSEIVCQIGKACKPMLLFCQLLFILYGVLLSVGYMYTAVVLHRKCVNGVIHASENQKIVRLIRIATAASVVAISVAGTHSYAASSEFGIYSDVTFVDAWDWWILQSVLRTEEIASCCVILLIAFRNPLGEKNKLRTWLTKLVNRQTTPASSVETRQIDSRDIGLTEKF